MQNLRAPRLVSIRAQVLRGLIACAVALSFLSASSGAAEDCFDPAADLDSNGYVADLFRFESEAVSHPFVLYREPCDGALYLVDVSTGERLVRVNESWRADDIISAYWLEDRETETIEVVANFSTGIGPEGAHPFSARFVLTRAEGSAFVSTYDEAAIAPWAVLPEEDYVSGLEARPLDLLNHWLSYPGEEEEERQLTTIHMGSELGVHPALKETVSSLPRRAASGQIEMLAEFSGLADDSVSAERIFAIANRVDGGWRIEQVWRQFRCARGGDPSAWTAALCP